MGCSSQSPELWNISPPPHPPTSWKNQLTIRGSCEAAYKLSFITSGFVLTSPPSVPQQKALSKWWCLSKLSLEFSQSGVELLVRGHSPLQKSHTAEAPSRVWAQARPTGQGWRRDLHHSWSTRPKAPCSLEKLWQAPVQDARASPDILPQSPRFPASEGPAGTPRPAAVQPSGLALVQAWGKGNLLFSAFLEESERPSKQLLYLRVGWEHFIYFFTRWDRGGRQGGNKGFLPVLTCELLKFA